MKPESLYSLRDLEFSYDGRSVLRIPDMDILQGRTLALVGANGSGKTTFLKILNDLLRPSSGTLLFRGRPSSENPELRSSSVYVHQSPFLLAGSVFHNVAFGLSVRRAPAREIEKRVTEALELVGLSGFQRRDAKKLSGGETQRVALARALAVKPEVLLLDEPTAQTDKASGEKIRALLASLAVDRGVTVILSSHDAGLAEALADRVVFLEDGMISRIEESPRNHA